MTFSFIGPYGLKEVKSYLLPFNKNNIDTPNVMEPMNLGSIIGKNVKFTFLFCKLTELFMANNWCVSFNLI